jgi:Mrp family chromosome partitioning ATPase
MTISAAIKAAGQLAETRRMFHAVEAALPTEIQTTTISVTSAVAGEGKSITAAALALVAARQLGRPVLLVDANWFAPAQHRLFDLPEADFDLTVWQREGNINRHTLPIPVCECQLFLLPAPRGGDHDPTALLEPLVREAREAFACTIFDTAAITHVNRHMLDPVSLSSCVDGTVLTVMINETPRPAVRQAQKQIEASGGRLLGIVVNESRNPLAEVPGSSAKAGGTWS